MKKKTHLLLFILIVTLIILTGCGNNVSIQKLAGEWAGGWTYNGNNISVHITINKDGSYIDTTVNGSNTKTETGIIKIEGNEVRFTSDFADAGTYDNYTPYQYKDGCLVNTRHTLRKMN